MAGRPDRLSSVDVVVIVGPDGNRQLKVDSARAFKDGLIVKFQEIRDRNQAEQLVKYKVYISDDSLVSPPGERIFLKQILNFTLVEYSSGKAQGKICGFASNGPQDLLQISYRGREVLVPFVDDFLVNIDFDKKEVTMDLPEGLLDVEEK